MPSKIPSASYIEVACSPELMRRCSTSLAQKQYAHLVLAAAKHLLTYVVAQEFPHTIASSFNNTKDTWSAERGPSTDIDHTIACSTAIINRTASSGRRSPQSKCFSS